MGIERVGVIGCGLMGAGIVQVAAQSGLRVTVAEANDDLLAKGRKRIDSSVRVAVRKGTLDQEKADACLANIEGVTDVAALANCDLVIEAATEKLNLKIELFGKLDEVCPESTIFASNTSSLSITSMAAATKRPDRFLGLHFFNPVPVMPLLEVVRAETTSDETVAVGKGFGEAVGKTVIVAKDTPGFIVNRLLIPYILDAVRLLESGVASAEEIDAGMKLGCGHPMGPLALLDFVGLDTTYYIAEIMFQEFKDARYAAPPLLKRLVTAGYHGRKSGRGIFRYGTGR
jgi:3-hydroxybutyryl-CoA dehydrogenase